MKIKIKFFIKNEKESLKEINRNIKKTNNQKEETRQYLIGMSLEKERLIRILQNLSFNYPDIEIDENL